MRFKKFRGNMPDNNQESDTRDVVKQTDSLLNSIEERISKLQVKLDHKESRAPDMLLGLAITISLVFVFIGGDFLELFGIHQDEDEYARLIGVAMLFYFGFAYALIAARRNVRRRQLLEELEGLKFQKNTLRPIKDTDKVTYFDRLVDINISNLSEYYKMVKEHTNKSFFASMIAGVIGFLLIVTGMLIGFTDLANADSVAYISAGSGVIVEFISGVFFWLYSKTTQQLKGYHDSLVDIQNVLLSFKVVEDTADKETKLEMAKIMITSLNSAKNA
ncbi:hypothetical protein ACM6XX_002567 [Vibrio parahaemolyticus]